MWDDRYAGEQYAYGTEPNEFLKGNFAHLPKGRVLSLGEGEGRNAVFLAQQGYEVTAVDGSGVGLAKAARLAHQRGVSIKTVQADLAEYDLGERSWDAIISIFVPLPSWLRKQVYGRIPKALTPGGVFLAEAYRPDQLKYGTGGGSSADTMQTAETIKQELLGLEFIQLTEVDRDVIEGSYHTGMGAVVQVIAKNPDRDRIV